MEKGKIPSIYYDDKTINKTLNNKKEFWAVEEIYLNDDENKKNFYCPLILFQFVLSASRANKGGEKRINKLLMRKYYNYIIDVIIPLERISASFLNFLIIPRIAVGIIS